jgi:3-isopropylmalate dehydrogenase
VRNPSEHAWSDCLGSKTDRSHSENYIVGVLPGEGVGPEVIRCALNVLRAVTDATDIQFELRHGGPIGRDAERLCGVPLSSEVIRFFEGIFEDGGAVLCGPGGGRFVYDLRKHFDLYFKISPIQVINGVPQASRLHAKALDGVDILIARENKAGLYQGEWNETYDARQNRVAMQNLAYSEPQVRRFLESSARLAKQRNSRLTVVWKESGVPSISKLWKDCAAEVSAELGIDYAMIDIDLMAYRLIQDASAFNVIAAPNLFGDVLADLGAVLLGSRGLSYSGNFTSQGHAVYQTNHGAAYDLAGSDRANPVGQILSLAMMLRESFELPHVAVAIENAVRSVWNDGYCTEDLQMPCGKIIGTAEMGRRIAECVQQELQSIRLRMTPS